MEIITRDETEEIADLVVSVQSRHGDLNTDAEALKTKLFGETRTFANTYRFTCKVEGRASNKAQTTYAVFHELYSIIESLEPEAEYEQWVEENYREKFEPIL